MKKHRLTWLQLSVAGVFTTIVPLASNAHSAETTNRFASKCSGQTPASASVRAKWGAVADLAGTVWITHDKVVKTYDWLDCKPGEAMVEYVYFGDDPRGLFAKFMFPDASGNVGRASDGTEAKLAWNETPAVAIGSVGPNSFVIGGKPSAVSVTISGTTMTQTRVGADLQSDPSSWSKSIRTTPEAALRIVRGTTKPGGATEFAGQLQAFTNGKVYGTASDNAPFPMFGLSDAGNEVLLILFDGFATPSRVVRFQKDPSKRRLNIVGSTDALGLPSTAARVTGPMQLLADGTLTIRTNKGTWRLQDLGSLRYMIKDGKGDFSDKNSRISFFTTVQDVQYSWVIPALSDRIIKTKFGYEYYYSWDYGKKSAMVLFSASNGELLGRCNFLNVPTKTTDLDKGNRIVRCLGSLERGGTISIEYELLAPMAFRRGGRVYHLNPSDPLWPSAAEAYDGTNYSKIDWPALAYMNIASFNDDWQREDRRNKRLAREASARRTAALEATVRALPGYSTATSNPLLTPTPGAPTMPRAMTPEETARWNEVERYKMREQMRLGEAPTTFAEDARAKLGGETSRPGSATGTRSSGSTEGKARVPASSDRASSAQKMTYVACGGWQRAYVYVTDSTTGKRDLSHTINIYYESLIGEISAAPGYSDVLDRLSRVFTDQFPSIAAPNRHVFSRSGACWAATSYQQALDDIRSGKDFWRAGLAISSRDSVRFENISWTPSE